MKEKTNIAICKWKILYKLISVKKILEKKNKTKTSMLLENNQPVQQQAAKSKKHIVT